MFVKIKEPFCKKNWNWRKKFSPLEDSESFHFAPSACAITAESKRWATDESTTMHSFTTFRSWVKNAGKRFFLCIYKELFFYCSSRLSIVWQHVIFVSCESMLFTCLCSYCVDFSKMYNCFFINNVTLTMAEVSQQCISRSSLRWHFRFECFFDRRKDCDDKESRHEKNNDENVQAKENPSESRELWRTTTFKNIACENTHCNHLPPRPVSCWQSFDS